MRDNGIPEAQAREGLDGFGGLAQEALSRLISRHDHDGTDVRQEHLDQFLKLLASDGGMDPASLLDAMLVRRLDPEMVACTYAGEAARVLGEGWLSDELSFVDVTIRSERIAAVVRRVDEMLVSATAPEGRSALILVAEAEQHTLGAYVLALQLRLAGYNAVVRVAPVTADLTALMAANRFDIALVSIGCTAGLESGVSLVRMLRLMSRGEIRIFVGGAVPVSDEVLLERTGADRALRDVSALLTELDDSVAGRPLDRGAKRRLGEGVGSSLKGDRCGT
ncbi:MAG: cobalamin B12-binding domain-containing protein [Acetobacteraceae bacterium]|nr:MAG: cobalamin B12-binding domain-containing protein [Acetobacteraceae bacterium]